MFMVAHCCYRMVIIVTDKDVIPFKIIVTKCHNSDGRFNDISEEPL
jgi:hypothetical protein